MQAVELPGSAATRYWGAAGSRTAATGWREWLGFTSTGRLLSSNGSRGKERGEGAYAQPKAIPLPTAAARQAFRSFRRMAIFLNLPQVIDFPHRRKLLLFI